MNNILLKVLPVVAFSLFASLGLVAQTGTNDEVIIIKDYEGKIQDANKINLTPAIPDIEEQKPSYTYSVPTRDFKDIPFEANPLKPLAVAKEKIEKYNTSFIKLGFGSQLTPLAQLAYNDIKSKNLKFGLFYNHLSAKGFSRPNQRFSDDEAGIYLKYFPAKEEVGFSFTFHNLRTHYYGYTDTTFDGKDVLQKFRDYDASIHFKNAKKNDLDLDHFETLRFNYLQETKGGGHEYFVNLNSDIQKHFGKYHTALFGFNGDVSSYSQLVNLQRNLFLITLGYQYNNDDWKAKGAFTFGVDGNSFYPLGEASVEKRLYEHSLIVFVGVERKRLKNSFADFVNLNPYVNSNLNLQNSTVLDVHGGFKGTVNSFSYLASISYKVVNSFALFLNDTIDSKRFEVIYDPKTKVFTPHVELGYNLHETLRLLLCADYDIFQLQTEAFAWHEPALRLMLHSSYNFKSKIIVGIDLFAFTSSNAKDKTGAVVSLKGTGDVNISLEYIFNKHLSFFGMGNNLANQKYQRWNGYPSFGISGIVGAKFSF